MQLRPYQEKFVSDIAAAWAAGAENVVGRLDTGGGKTACLSHIVSHNAGGSCVIAHRQELVGQICAALSRFGVSYRIIAPRDVCTSIVAQVIEDVGVMTYNPNARVGVAGVDTLIRRGSELEAWAKGVSLWVTDEAHHHLGGKTVNKWGKATALFPNARGLGLTATPERPDGKGLGRHADGVFDALVEGPPMRWLIDQGYLTDYRVVVPLTADLDLSGVNITASGDYNPQRLAAATRRSSIVGDVVREYLRRGERRRWLTFATDVESAQEFAAAFNAAGVPASAIWGDMPSAERRRLIRQLKSGELLQLVSCDLIGEGTDLPAVEGISMARKTASEIVYRQQFGRMLRPSEGKAFGMLIDHVGNWLQHGAPDRADKIWSLNGRDRRSLGPSDAIPYRICTNPSGGPQGAPCATPYPRTQWECPCCGYAPEPVFRSGPEHVDGDLIELSPEALAAARGELERANWTDQQVRDHFAMKRLPHVLTMAQVNRHAERRQALDGLKEVMALWGGKWHAAGESDREIQRRFYLTFGVDVLTAQALDLADAEKLAAKVASRL